MVEDGAFLLRDSVSPAGNVHGTRRSVFATPDDALRDRRTALNSPPPENSPPPDVKVAALKPRWWRIGGGLWTHTQHICFASNNSSAPTRVAPALPRAWQIWDPQNFPSGTSR